MITSNPWKSYKQIATQTAPPGQLVLMLYEGAIRFLDQSLTGFDMDDPAEANQTINNNVLRAQDILTELNFSLNVELGGELAMTLRRLYEYLDRRLVDSNINKTPEGIKEAISRLSVLRDAWKTMLQQQSGDRKSTRLNSSHRH